MGIKDSSEETRTSDISPRLGIEMLIGASASAKAIGDGLWLGAIIGLAILISSGTRLTLSIRNAEVESTNQSWQASRWLLFIFSIALLLFSLLYFGINLLGETLVISIPLLVIFLCGVVALRLSFDNELWQVRKVYSKSSDVKISIDSSGDS